MTTSPLNTTPALTVGALDQHASRLHARESADTPDSERNTVQSRGSESVVTEHTGCPNLEL